MRYLLGQYHRQRLVIGLDDYTYRSPLIESIESHGEANHHRSLDLLAGLQFVFGSQGRLRIRLQCWKCLIVAVEIDGGNCVATLLSTGSHELAFNAVYPE